MSAAEEGKFMDRDMKIKKYSEMINLGDDMVECDMRKIIRKTSQTIKDDKGKNVCTVVEIEEINFS